MQSGEELHPQTIFKLEDARLDLFLPMWCFCET